MARQRARSLTLILAVLIASSAAALAAAADETVSCGSTEGLRTAIRNANAAGGAGYTIHLVQGCTWSYVNAASDGVTSALPTITGNVTIEGHGATITRTDGPFFRFAYIGVGATLTLRDLEVSFFAALPGANGCWNCGGASPNGHQGSNGGAIDNNNGTLKIQRSTFRSNRAGMGGQGIDCDNDASGHTGFDGGIGGNGGAIRNGGTLTIEDSAFISNTAGEGGQGGACKDGTDLFGVYRSVGSGGAGGHGGAIYNELAAPLTITNSAFTSNVAGTGGDMGAIAASNYPALGGRGGNGGAIASIGFVTIEDSDLKTNQGGPGGKSTAGPGAGGDGGAVHALQGNLYVRRSLLQENVSGTGGVNDSGPDGAPGKGAGVFFNVAGAIESSVFYLNRVDGCNTGVGLYVSGTNVLGLDVVNDTFKDNYYGGPGCTGATVFTAAPAASVRVLNSILSANAASCGGTLTDSGHNIAFAQLGGLTGCEPSENSNSQLKFQYGDPKIDVGGTAGRPQLGSPAIDKGADSTLATSDIRGIVRPQGPARDIGAYEIDHGAVVLQPADLTVAAPASATFTARFDGGVDHTLVNLPKGKWQMSTNGGTSWADVTTPVDLSWFDSANDISQTTYTRTTTSSADDGALFRAVFITNLDPGGIPSNAAKLSVSYQRITTDLPPTTNANLNSILNLSGAWEANPAFTTFVSEYSTDLGATWKTIYTVDVSCCKTKSASVISTFVSSDMNNRLVRFRLSGPTPLRTLTSTITTIRVTNDPAAPYWEFGTVQGTPAIEGDGNGPAQFVGRALGGNPVPSIGWQRWDGTNWIDLANGPDPFDYHFNTAPDNYFARLSFAAWAYRDGEQFRGILSGSYGTFPSQPATLYVSVPTTTTIDCPSKALLGGSFTCHVQVTPNPIQGPRPRKTCGDVIDLVDARCRLDANGSCDLNVVTASIGLALEGMQTKETAKYIGGYYGGACTDPTANPDGPVGDQLSTAESVLITASRCIPPPITVCPAGQTAPAGADGTAPVPDFTGSVQLGQFGPCDVTVTQVPPEGTAVHAGTIPITITATSEGGGSTTCHTTFTVTCPETPVITIDGDNPATADCTGYVDAGATARACNVGVPVTVSSNVKAQVPGTYTVTYTAGTATATRTVIVQSGTPTITLNGASTLTVECHGSYTELGAVGHDSCGVGAGAATPSGTVNVNVPGTYTITYGYTDGGGQTAAPATRTVIVADTQKPVIALNGTSPMTIECHGSFSDPGAVANDACAGSFAATPSGSVNVNAPGTYTITYTASDPSGNAAAPVTRQVIVSDTTPPTVSPNGANPMTLSCGATYVEPGASASDACAGTFAATPSGSVNSAVPGAYTITYTATDPSGNKGTATRTVNVLAVDPPTISLNGASVVTLECHGSYTELGAVGHDACGGSGAASPSGVVDANTPGTYTVTYNFTDAYGHAATPVTRTVNVVDTTKPVITVAGQNPVSAECHGSYTDAGATALDSCAGSLAVSASGYVDTTKPGSYTITYTAKDPSGNTATATRTVNVGDSTPPVLALNGTSPVTVECHGTYTELGATATDSCAGSYAATPSGLVDANTPGSYTVTYNAVDPSGNAAAPITRTVNVVDTTKPTVSVPANITVAAVPGTCGAPVTFTVTPSDVCDASPKLVLSHASGSTFPLGTTTVTATATDASGNSGNASFTVTVVKTPTSTSLALSPASQQYSDAGTLTATVTDGLTSSPVTGGTVTFKIGGSTVGTSSIGAGGVATLTLALVESASLAKADLSPGGHTVTATYNGDAACYAGSSDSKTLTITAENALVQYTGVNWAPACSASSAVVTFSASVTDFADASRGAISNATLTFVDRDKGTTLCTTPVGLVSSSDKTLGTAACNATLAVGEYRIGLIVGGFYSRNDPDDDDQVLEVATSCGTGIITGGGYLTLANPSGSNAGDKGSKSNFGFNVHYNKQYTNLQGSINTIIRKGGRLYQVKGNSMTSLQTNTATSASHPWPTAIFFGKASLQDVTDPANPVPLPNGGGAILRVTMTDKSDPKGGTSAVDTIGITVWYSPSAGGGLFFSSNWDGSTTVEQALGGNGGGNLTVR